jgi:hypothetical protein
MQGLHIKFNMLESLLNAEGLPTLRGAKVF